MAKVETVAKARKSPGNCCGCGETIAVGSPYKYVAFRYGGKRIKCGKCNFRQSELTQSKMSGVYAAQESAEEAIEGWDPGDGNVEDLKSALEQAADEIRSVADEYAEAGEAMGGAGEEMTDKGLELESFADDVASAADDLEDFEFEEEEPEGPGDEPDEADTEAHEAWKKLEAEWTLAHATWSGARTNAHEEWAKDQRQKASDAVSECPV